MSSMPQTVVATPKPRAASPFQSESSGTSTESDCFQASCDHGESREMPNRWTPSASNADRLSRRRRSSFVQVGDQSQR
jgi:hypothetical protein